MVGNWKLDWRLEIGDWRLEIGDWIGDWAGGLIGGASAGLRGRGVCWNAAGGVNGEAEIARLLGFLAFVDPGVAAPSSGNPGLEGAFPLGKGELWERGAFLHEIFSFFICS